MPMTSRAVFLSLASGLAVSPVALAQDAALPLSRVTLYRSGVASFEHRGTVSGDEVLRLSFDADDLSDVLKSIVMLDPEGDHTPTASYAPRRDLNTVLGGFPINPRMSMIGVLEQLRGERVRIVTPEGPVSGALYGTEMITDAETGFARQHITLITDAGFRTIERAQIRSLDFEDAEVAGEVRGALRTLAEYRDQDKAALDVTFDGTGERGVLITYIHKAPVWKPSYRLVLPEGDGGPVLQAWAIVENLTDEDWDDVTLTVAAGQPVSFTMDLQTPFTPARPAVPPPYALSMAPTVFERGLKIAQDMPADELESGARAARQRSMAALSDMVAGEALAPSAPAFEADGLLQNAGATAADAGDQFVFTFDTPVSIEGGHSAMLPLASDRIDGERVTVYTPGAPSAMLGIELVNTSGLELMPGPIAVYDSGSYAGDAQTSFVSQDENRLITFAADQDVSISAEPTITQTVAGVAIADGVLVERVTDRAATAYRVVNHDPDRGRRVLIEHPERPGWTPVGKPAPVDESASFDRYEVSIAADAAGSLTVTQERERFNRYAVADYGVDALAVLVRNGSASPAVLEAVRTAAGLRDEVRRVERAIEAGQARLNEITRDQQRLRENMNRVGRTSELWARYTAKLAAQEDEIESVLTARETLTLQLDRAQGALREFLRDLNVS